MLRRSFLTILAAGCALPLRSAQRWTSYPFPLGVASGDPWPDGVVLWTRLILGSDPAPDTRNANIAVEWKVAEDEKMAHVVKRGTTAAEANAGHSVHVEVRGLRPDRVYWYQFKAGSEWSPIGRTRTASAANSRPERLRFAFASCQHWETGYFTAYEHMIQEDLDLIIHLGDYIYEGGARTDQVRAHTGGEINSLSDYRNRYALYRTDPHLQRAHQLYPWIVTWDDHEVDNNYADDKDQDGSGRESFLERRSNAYQAYYEHMPLRRAAVPHGSKLNLYRGLAYGDLADFSVLDTRQYRTDQPCSDGNKPQCPEALSQAGTLLGARQESWLFQRIASSKAHWNVLAQQVLMAKVDRMAGPEQTYAMDQWSGYEVARKRVLKALNDNRARNPVVLTGDIHSNWVCDLKADFDRPDSPIVGTEFVGTSITSGGDGADILPAVEKYLPENPHVKFYNSQRGYVSCTVTPKQWQSDYRVLSHVSRPGSPISTRAKFIVESGKPGAQRA